MTLSKSCIMMWLCASTCFWGAAALKSYAPPESPEDEGPPLSPEEEAEQQREAELGRDCVNFNVTSAQYTKFVEENGRIPLWTECVKMENENMGRPAPRVQSSPGCLASTHCANGKLLQNDWAITVVTNGSVNEYTCAEAAAMRDDDLNTCIKVRHHCCWPEKLSGQSTTGSWKAQQSESWKKRNNPYKCRCQDAFRLFVYTSYSLDQCKQKCLDDACGQLSWHADKFYGVAPSGNGIGYCNTYNTTCDLTQCDYGSKNRPEWTILSPGTATKRLPTGTTDEQRGFAHALEGLAVVGYMPKVWNADE